jgi:membrane AbrB-like protein
MAAIGMALAKWLHIPGGAIIGAMILTAIARLLNAPLDEPPSWLRTVARIVLGLTIGATVTTETIQAVARALLPVSVMVVAMMALGLVVAWAVHRWAHMALPTALCGTAPGALSGMVTLADSLGGRGRGGQYALGAPDQREPNRARYRARFVHPAGAAVATLPAAVETASPLLRLVILLALGLVVGLWVARFKIPAGDLLAG